jgi:putative acetyltransferase
MKPSATIVEVTTAGHLEFVRGLFQRYQSELPAELRFPDGEWQALPGAYRPPDGALLLAMAAGQPVGCVGLRRFPLPDMCEMKRLYVTSEFRGQNLGVALVDRIIHAARTLGYKSMRLDTHLATMGAAVTLYRRFGFVEVPSDPMPHVDGLTYLKLRL